MTKLNGTNYYVWSNNMQVALLAHLLWLFIKGLEECSLKPSFNPFIDVDSKLLIPMLLRYKNWVTSKKEYFDWLYSDLVAMGLMWNTINITIQDLVLKEPCIGFT